MLIEWLNPLLEWLGITIIPFMLLLILIVLIFKE